MRIKGLCVLILGGLLSLPYASAQPLPQTARQALIEMLFSKKPGTFEQHLPQSTRAALRKSGTAPGASLLGAYSAMIAQLGSRGQQFQTFESGPVLMSIEDPQAHGKFEIVVQRDDLQGEEDEIELSFQGYKDGEAQTAGAKFRLTLTMKQESGTWRLNEVTVAVKVSLTDPGFVKALETDVTQMKGATSTGSSQVSMSAPPDMIVNTADDSSAVRGIRTLTTAEASYAAAYGHFTCTLSDLGGMGSGGGPNEHQAMLIDPRLAVGRKNGYVFALGGCEGNPAARYSVSAVPSEPNVAARALCSDESAVIRFSPDGKAESCFSAGQPLR